MRGHRNPASRAIVILKEGYWYGLPLAIATAGSLVLGLEAAAVIFLILAILVFNFFRDPHRAVPGDPGAIVSPADGRIVQIAEEKVGDRPTRRLSIFMSPLDVHVNRSPAAGVLREVVYRKGRFRLATDERASAANEQNVFTLESAAGPIVVKQIAGLIARRIVFWKRVGDRLERGERVGLIKFGSRVDVLLDPAIELCVKIGDRVLGGTTILGLVAGASRGGPDTRPSRQIAGHPLG